MPAMAPMQAPALDHMILKVTKQILADFRPQFIHTMDAERHRMHTMYRECSTLFWNGTMCKGPTNINALYTSLPASKTSFETMDVQPINSLYRRLPHARSKGQQPKSKQQ